MREIWSGAQTGVDRAALDVAHDLGAHHRRLGPCWPDRGGWHDSRALCRATGDGNAGLSRADHPKRRRQRRHADPLSPPADGRNRLHPSSKRFASAGPHLAVNLTENDPLEAATLIHEWLDPLPGSRLNVAGPRAKHRPRGSMLSRKQCYALSWQPDPESDGDPLVYGSTRRSTPLDPASRPGHRPAAGIRQARRS